MSCDSLTSFLWRGETIQRFDCTHGVFKDGTRDAKSQYAGTGNGRGEVEGRGTGAFLKSKRIYSGRKKSTTFVETYF